MGLKYCPNCKEIFETKVIGGYSQVLYQSIPVKRRKISHTEADGGCGHMWYSCEVSEEVLDSEED